MSVVREFGGTAGGVDEGLPDGGRSVVAVSASERLCSGKPLCCSFHLPEILDAFVSVLTVVRRTIVI